MNAHTNLQYFISLCFSRAAFFFILEKEKKKNSSRKKTQNNQCNLASVTSPKTVFSGWVLKTNFVREKNTKNCIENTKKGVFFLFGQKFRQKTPTIFLKACYIVKLAPEYEIPAFSKTTY